MALQVLLGLAIAMGARGCSSEARRTLTMAEAIPECPCLVQSGQQLVKATCHFDRPKAALDLKG